MGQRLITMDIYKIDVQFEVKCVHCGEKFTVIRNWGGGLRRLQPKSNSIDNPAKCSCGSINLEVY